MFDTVLIYFISKYLYQTLDFKGYFKLNVQDTRFKTFIRLMSQKQGAGGPSPFIQAWD